MPELHNCTAFAKNMANICFLNTKVQKAITYTSKINKVLCMYKKTNQKAVTIWVYPAKTAFYNKCLSTSKRGNLKKVISKKPI